MRRWFQKLQRRAAGWLLLFALLCPLQHGVSESPRGYVDFAAMQTDAPHLVAWLYQPDMGVDEPVMQAKNNTLYDDLLPNGRRGSEGAIHLDRANQPDFSDAITYLYGSAEHEGSRFAFLARYAEPAYCEAHPGLRLLTPYGDFELVVFACVPVERGDNESWRLGSIEEREPFAEAVRGIRARSLIQGGLPPQWGERIVALCAEKRRGGTQRYVVYCRLLPDACAAAERYDIVKQPMDDAPSIAQRKQVGTLGDRMVYAQNDPLWAGMTYESNLSSKKRTFGDAGCGPTAVANALVNLLSEDALPDIEASARYSGGFVFCACSVNQYHCRADHLKYHIQTKEEFLRYYPLVVAGFASGNNPWRRSARTAAAGTGMSFCAQIAKAYGLAYTNPQKASEALKLLDGGAMIVANTAGRYTPFTGGGHYVTLAGKDDEYLYILDPLWKDDYSAFDKHGVLEVLSPGVLRARLADIPRLKLYSYHAFSKE